MKRIRSSAKGQAIIEMVAAILVFVFMVLTTCSICVFLYLQFALITAAREGSRAASINPDLAGANSASAIATAKTRVKDFFSAATAQTLTDGDITVTGPTGATVGNRTVDVQVNFTFDNPLDFAGLFGSDGMTDIPMSASASMRYEE